MDNSASLSCAENIALFHFLHASRGRDGALWRDSVPVLPSVAPAGALPTKRGDYILSFERERSLAGALAFISQVEDDPDHVPAVCIQEDHYPRKRPSLHILLAVNKSKCNDGGKILEATRKHLEGIFEELSQLVDDVHNDQVHIEHKIRRLIVSMCLERILSRLRLTTIARRNTKQHPRARFQNVIHALSSHGNASMKSSKHGKVSAEELDLFVKRLREVVSLIDAYTHHPRQQQVEDLVDAIYRLRQLDCETLLNTIPDSDKIGPTSKTSTLNMIRKVARYAEAARFLFRTSKKFPIARRVQVEVVSLPDAAFTRIPLEPTYRIGIASMLARVKAPKRSKGMTQQSQMDTICRLLGTGMDQAEEDLTKQAARTHRTGKIHAEVQLIVHYENLRNSGPYNNTFLPPRIVSSSKKACFLCDLLLKVHGKMRTPWSHGKLYPGWRVPAYPGLDLQERFNAVLEDCIRKSIRLLFERGERTAYPDPRESTLITLPSLASALDSVLVLENDDRVEMNENHTESTQTMSKINSNTAKVDQKDLRPSSGPASSVTNMISVDGEASHEANARAESDTTSQYSSLNHSHKMENTVEASSEQDECLQRELLSCGKEEEGAQNIHDTPSRKGSHHSEHVKHEDHALEYDNLSEISDEATNSPEPEEQSSQPAKSCVDSVNSLDTYHHLKRGQKLPQTVRCEQMRTFFTKSLVVQVEYSTGPSLEAAVGKKARELPFSIERLEVDEIARLKEEGNLQIGNEAAVIGERPLVLPSMDHVYVAAKGVVFKITFR